MIDILHHLRALRWYHFYALGVLVSGVRHLLSYRLGRSQSSYDMPEMGRVDTRYLSVGVLSVLWPFVLLTNLALSVIGKSRWDRWYGGWLRTRGFYYENELQPDGRYECIMMPLEHVRPCLVCGELAPPMHVGSDALEDCDPRCCTKHQFYLCKAHRTNEIVGPLVKQASGQTTASAASESG